MSDFDYQSITAIAHNCHGISYNARHRLLNNSDFLTFFSRYDVDDFRNTIHVYFPSYRMEIKYHNLHNPVWEISVFA